MVTCDGEVVYEYAPIPCGVPCPNTDDIRPTRVNGVTKNLCAGHRAKLKQDHPVSADRPATDCPRAKSDMTPCIIRDGEVALADDGACVGCGWRPPPAADQEEGVIPCEKCGSFACGCDGGTLYNLVDPSPAADRPVENEERKMSGQLRATREVLGQKIISDPDIDAEAGSAFADIEGGVKSRWDFRAALHEYSDALFTLGNWKSDRGVSYAEANNLVNATRDWLVRTHEALVSKPADRPVEGTINELSGSLKSIVGENSELREALEDLEQESYNYRFCKAEGRSPAIPGHRARAGTARSRIVELFASLQQEAQSLKAGLFVANRLREERLAEARAEISRLRAENPEKWNAECCMCGYFGIPTKLRRISEVG